MRGDLLKKFIAQDDDVFIRIAKQASSFPRLYQILASLKKVKRALKNCSEFIVIGHVERPDAN